MPVVLRIGPYAFLFYSNERQEPPHIHVERDAETAKFWLNPVRNSANHGFRNHELNVILRLVTENEAFLLERWHAYFNG
jgi:hypothetical protein